MSLFDRRPFSARHSGRHSVGVLVIKGKPATVLVIAVAGLLLTGCPHQATAEERPLWELGAGLFPSSFPAYRGSESRKNYLLPFPYLVYRGDIFKVDRRGARALLFDSDRLKLNLSFNAAIPVKSKDTNARDGMPDLDPTFEIGPLLNIRLAGKGSGRTLSLRLPVRYVIATDLNSVEHVGWVFQPALNLDTKFSEKWNVGVSTGPLFADQDFHHYYYGVETRYATPERPAYRAKSGYNGLATIFSFSRRFSQIWVGGFLRYDNLSGVSFNDSPLLETDHSVMGGISVAWIFSESSKMVSAESE
jgi:outer membrane scaffolding protein for murein synthesis (MipA/OmpV family)